MGIWFDQSDPASQELLHHALLDSVDLVAAFLQLVEFGLHVED